MYRVTRGDDGTRDLYLFPHGATGPGYCVITLDPADDDGPERVAVVIRGAYRDWSIDAFAALLDSLEGQCADCDQVKGHTNTCTWTGEDIERVAARAAELETALKGTP